MDGNYALRVTMSANKDDRLGAKIHIMSVQPCIWLINISFGDLLRSSYVVVNEMTVYCRYVVLRAKVCAVSLCVIIWENESLSYMDFDGISDDDNY